MLVTSISLNWKHVIAVLVLAAAAYWALYDQIWGLRITLNTLYWHQHAIVDRMARGSQIDEVVDLIEKLHPDAGSDIESARQAIKLAGAPIPEVEGLVPSGTGTPLYVRPLQELGEWIEPSDDVPGTFAIKVGNDRKGQKSAVVAMRRGMISKIEDDAFRPDARLAIWITHNFGEQTYYGNVIAEDGVAVGDFVDQGERFGVTEATSLMWLRVGLIDSAGNFVVDPWDRFPPLARRRLSAPTDDQFIDQ